MPRPPTVRRSTAGRLVVAGAPLGDPADASVRLARLLATADVVAAEDTRRLRRLAGALGVRPTGRVWSYYDPIESDRAATLLAELRAGATVVLVTDAGMPLVSDPGYRLVTAAVADGIPVTVAPGPSAVTAALAVAGLPVDRFCFEGFLPRAAGARRRRLAELTDEPRTMVFFVTARGLAGTLSELAAAFGADRPAAVCRELTKPHEQVHRGPLGELVGWAAGGVRGEVSVVVAGAPADRPRSYTAAELAEAVAARRRAGASRRDAVAAVAGRTGARRRDVYAAALAADRPADAGPPSPGSEGGAT